MRRFLPYVAIFAMYVMMPLSAEATENLVHFLVDGHLAHGSVSHPAEEGQAACHGARDGASHGEDGTDEHGCSGSFHMCSCHVASSILPMQQKCRPPMARPAVAPPARMGGVAEGHAAELFRPPIA